ncbi:MAG: hypothetical protein LRY71_08465 [Bacillaceae bacterium]|nr:hypothetical protein [Bacillaceae bacterium]
MLKKGIVVVVDTVFYKILKTKQKQFIANLFTQKQKERLKKIIKPGKKRTQMRQIERLKYRLYNLGFFERALAELQHLANSNEDLYLRRLAFWELALWYANQYTEDGANHCLQYLEQATKGVKDEDQLRRAAILKAECYEILQQLDKGKQVIRELLLGKNTRISI